MSDQEKVMVVETAKVKELLNGQFNYKNFNRVYEFANENHKFLMRKNVETNKKYKQIIPYVVIQSKGKGIFLIKRTKAQSEDRLHDKYSIGIGGHINRDDKLFKDSPILSGMRRELDEEITILGNRWVIKPIGTINDESNDVGAVHLGMVYLLLADVEIEINEKDKMTGEWVQMDDLGEYREGMETWSQIVYDYLKEQDNLAKLVESRKNK